MRTHTLLAAAVGISILAIAIWQLGTPLTDGAPEQAANQRPADLPERLDLPAPPPAVATPLEKSSPNSSMESAGVPPAAAWQAGTAPASISLSNKITQRSAVRVDEALMAKLEPGDSVEMALPDGLNVQAKVERVETSLNGDRSWFGRVDDASGDYPVVYTQGKNSAFATITTSSGSYTLETTGGAGWVYQNPPEPVLVKPGSTDYKLPNSQH